MWRMYNLLKLCVETFKYTRWVSYMNNIIIISNNTFGVYAIYECELEILIIVNLSSCENIFLIYSRYG